MYLNNMVDDDFELSNENFLEIPMPNEAGFFMDDRDTVELPEFMAEPCMTGCAEGVEITMRAAVLDVTPETATDAADEQAEPETAADPPPPGPARNSWPQVKAFSASVPAATRSVKARATGRGPC
jgi:hypothetical protein